MVPVPLGLCRLGDRPDNSRHGEDGSLVLTIGHDEAEEKANWLSAPDGSFSLRTRLYWPEQTALNGCWTPPFRRKARSTIF
jgi:hypothetical protein